MGPPVIWILLVDPLRNLLNTYRMILEGEAYRVEMETDLKNVQGRFLSRRYAVLMTECYPPFEKTLEALRWVKTYSPETYILIVTNTLIDDRSYGELFDAGADDVLIKPYPPEKVLAHIKRGLRLRQLVLKNQELEGRSILDETGFGVKGLVFSRTHFSQCLRQELKRAKRHVRPFSLLLVEIPDRKALGDRLERFCAELARVLRKNIREEDLVGRENGDFGILLPETDQRGTEALVRRLLALVQSDSAFEEDEHFRQAIRKLSFRSFSYPGRFDLPESLMAAVEDIEGKIPSS